MSSNKPIFISYAPEDIEAARRIAAALQESGIEARIESTKGGDLRREIEDSALFLAIISQNAESHQTANFRNEWEIAADYMDTLPRGVPFLLPIIIDETEEYGGTTPSAFGGVHWIRQPEGETSADLVQEVVRLLTIPRGPVYFPPIPPGLSRPPFSMKKRNKGVDLHLPVEKAAPAWLKPAIGGGVIVVFVALGFIMFSTPSQPDVQPTMPEDNPVIIEPDPVVEEVAPPPVPVPESLTDEAIWANYESSRLTHDYAAAVEHLTGWIDRQSEPSSASLMTLAWVTFARDLNPEAYLSEVIRIAEDDDENTANWLPPIAYGLQRDFANQRRAIRGGAGAITVHFAADTSKVEIALTESYMDQGNWALARHYGNQARRALEDSLSPAAVGPILNGQFEAFLGMTRRNPEAIGILDSLMENYGEHREISELLLIRALIDQEKLDRALDLIGKALREPSLLDAASVLFLPPYDQLHGHPAFRATMEPHVAADEIDKALAWVAERKSGAQSRTPIY
jgi:hypothetical protein